MSKIVRYQSEEWSGLYIDGYLDTYGDHYLVDERIGALLEVEYRDSNSWLDDNKRVPIQKLSEVEKRELQAQADLDKAVQWRAKAAELKAEAENLDEAAARLELGYE